jgi:hypothetical protein
VTTPASMLATPVGSPSPSSTSAADSQATIVSSDADTVTISKEEYQTWKWHQVCLPWAHFLLT